MEYKKKTDIKKQSFEIKKLSQLSGVTEGKIRRYTNEGILIPTLVDNVSKYRYFSKEHVDVVKTINFLAENGVSIEEQKKHLKKEELNYLNLLLEAKELAYEKITQMQKYFFDLENTEEEIKKNSKIKLDVVYKKKFISKSFKITSYENTWDDKIFVYDDKNIDMFNLKEVYEDKEANYETDAGTALFIHSKTKTIHDATKIFKKYINIDEPFVVIETAVITANIKEGSPIREICLITYSSL